jgi:uncharacterized membrane protein
MHFTIPYIATLLVFVCIDLLWLGFVAKGFYKSELGDLMANKFNYWAAAAFYLIYAAGVVVFAVRPALISGNWTEAALSGALFGFIAYATYDLTNLSSLRSWPVLLTFVDMLWGTILSALAASLAFMITRHWIAL